MARDIFPLGGNGGVRLLPHPSDVPMVDRILWYNSVDPMLATLGQGVPYRVVQKFLVFVVFRSTNR